MTDFCYCFGGTKWLLVRRDEDMELVGKFNLTEIGLERINSFAELRELVGEEYYEYNEGKKK